VLTDELLAQADTLATGTAQADLRRSISAAYYAVFHFILTAAADMVCGSANRSTLQYRLVYRSVDHGSLTSLCGQLTDPQKVAIKPSSGLGRIADFVKVTTNLQRQRHQADYDPLPTFTGTEAEQAISNARQAIVWFNACDDEQRRAFLTMLLFRERK
jgi:hypothetical protein